MEILLSWLRDFVDIPEAPAETAEALTMAGLAVDAIREEDGEHVFELDVTANRPDALSHFGVAREISAIFDRPLRRPISEVSEIAEAAESRASVEILDPDLCARYSARVLLDVEIKPSPDWIRKRLELCGLRSINNIADLTNYVLLETGHPTHAFDLDLLDQSKIIVRRAVAGEELRTLDGLDRNLNDDRLVIADGSRAVALAGVMGGIETEISDSTRNVLLEAAWFEPGSIRRTSRRLGMHTEASHRFERGADVEATVWALDRIAHWVGQLSSGGVLEGVIDAYPKQFDPPSIELRAARISRVLGSDIPTADVERILAALGFAVEETDEGWGVQPPSFRLDVEREIDLIEEVARIHGYHHLPTTLPSSAATIQEPPQAAQELRTRSVLRSLGYDETVAYAFIGEEEAKQFGKGNTVAIRNPVSELWAVMRNTAVPTMIRALEWNLNRNEPDVKLMEIGRLYRSENGGFREPPTLVLGACGMARRPSLGDAGIEFDFYELKSDVERLLGDFQLGVTAFEAGGVPEYYQPGQSACIVADRKTVGYLGALDAKVTADRKIRRPVFIAEIALDRLWDAGLRERVFQPAARVPASYRDFSLIVPEGVSFSEVCAAIGRQEFLVRLEPIEIFRGRQVSEGFYSLLLRAVWQKGDENLTDEEVNQYAALVTGSLSKTLGIRQRV